MHAIYGNMDPINIPQMLAYIPAPWILWEIANPPGELERLRFRQAEAKVIGLP